MAFKRKGFSKHATAYNARTRSGFLNKNDEVIKLMPYSKQQRRDETDLSGPVDDMSEVRYDESGNPYRVNQWDEKQFLEFQKTQKDGTNTVVDTPTLQSKILYPGGKQETIDFDMESAEGRKEAAKWYYENKDSDNPFYRDKVKELSTLIDPYKEGGREIGGVWSKQGIESFEGDPFLPVERIHAIQNKSDDEVKNEQYSKGEHLRDKTFVNPWEHKVDPDDPRSATYEGPERIYDDSVAPTGSASATTDVQFEGELNPKYHKRSRRGVVDEEGVVHEEVERKGKFNPVKWIDPWKGTGREDARGQETQTVVNNPEMREKAKKKWEKENKKQLKLNEKLEKKERKENPTHIPGKGDKAGQWVVNPDYNPNWKEEQGYEQIHWTDILPDDSQNQA
tara:strand:+ start:990 stop:2171 length:1182 start_codon:yes stop_codon:yes gene_type:complete